MADRARRSERAGRRERVARTLFLVVLIVAQAARAAAAGEDVEKERIGRILARSVLDPHARAGLERALRLAIRKLETPACREIFSAFPGAWDGPPLASGRQPQNSLLDSLTFRNGMAYRVCRDSHVLAYTHPGEPSVYLCGDQFSRAAFGNLDFAANILIHEGLHTLGLRENPPSPGAITARVSASCQVGRPADASSRDGAAADGGKP